MLSWGNKKNNLGPVVQSLISLTSLLVVKMLTVLVSTVSDLKVFLLKKFCKCKSYSHFFRKNISVYAIFDDRRFNNTLSNDIVSFEQLGPVYYLPPLLSSYCSVEHIDIQQRF